jgi:ABC-type transport system involved in Fe-S cluster assembly fused permease/ATPase subunit
MRHGGCGGEGLMRWSPPSEALPSSGRRNDWQALRALLPYLWAHKGRVIFALACLVAAKLATVSVPILLKDLVDRLSPTQQAATGVLLVPVALVVAYGLLRLSTSLFTELREFFFVNVTQAAMRTLALKTFRHLHALSLRYHLERRTGAVTREIDQGIRGISSLISFTLYSILPTLIEISLVVGYLIWKYEIWFAGIVGVSLFVYIGFTVAVTNWRTTVRRRWNELESKAQSRAVDSLLNFETVKYFGNEDYEARRYDETLADSQRTAVLSQQSLNVLNAGQQTIIAIALTLILWRAALGVVEGRMTIGDLVLVNAFMIQLYIPLNFLGVIYREIKQSLIDMDRMFSLLEQHREIADAPGAVPLAVGGAEIRFEGVDFAYDARRQVLRDISFVVPAGSRLIDGQDVRSVTQASLRAAIGIVPQDTVLFNDTIEYNIAYGRPGASHNDVVAAARAAHIHDFIESLPDGYRTMVGERGLKLSGGEKQRVAIARTLLKQPAVLVFDEATSALDSRTERVIQQELEGISRSRTTLVIAHRLSTVVHADQIVVMDHGRIIERGTHAELLAHRGAYAAMWEIQSREQAKAEAVLAA